MSVVTALSIDKYWLAEKCHLNLTFLRMWLKLWTTLKFTFLAHICSCSSVGRWTQRTHNFSYTQKWDGFLMVDHGPGILNNESCYRDFFEKNSNQWQHISVTPSHCHNLHKWHIQLAQETQSVISEEKHSVFKFSDKVDAFKAYV